MWTSKKNRPRLSARGPSRRCIASNVTDGNRSSSTTSVTVASAMRDEDNHGASALRGDASHVWRGVESRHRRYRVSGRIGEQVHVAAQRQSRLPMTREDRKSPRSPDNEARSSARACRELADMRIQRNMSGWCISPISPEIYGNQPASPPSSIIRRTGALQRFSIFRRASSIRGWHRPRPPVHPSRER